MTSRPVIDPVTPVAPSATPQRVQLRRTKGWRKPEGCVNVARPGYWGNPWKVDDPHPEHGWPMSRQEAVTLYRWWLEEPGASGFLRKVEARIELEGRNLACWCALDQACHADVLLEIANPSAACPVCGRVVALLGDGTLCLHDNRNNSNYCRGFVQVTPTPQPCSVWPPANCCRRCHGDGGWYRHAGPYDWDWTTCQECQGTGAEHSAEAAAVLP